MANCCDYEMKIVGKKEDVEKLISYLKSDYSYTNVYDKNQNCYIDKLSFCEAEKHFFRVINIWEVETAEIDANKYVLIAEGCCAWSVYKCMMPGEYSYYDDLERTTMADDFRGTNMIDATKDLNLKVEIFSADPSNKDMEHYIVDKGEIKISEYSDYKTIYNEETCEYKEVGGFEWCYEI